MNHYPRHVGDIISATIGLTLMERGAYTALLDQYYARELPLPTDKREVYRMAAAATAAERKAVDYVLGRYFTLAEDGWHQARADRELTAFRERSESAKRSVNVRWSKRNTNVSEPYAERNANQEPVTSNQNQEPKPKAEPTTKPPPAAPSDLVPAELWASFRETRRALKAPLTPKAEVLLIAQLRRLQADGDDPARVVEQSIERGWKGFFPIDRGKLRSVQTQADKRAVVAAAIWGTRAGGGDDNAIDGTAERVA